jgi:RNA polymerase sigma-70 factor (ECF subfamily)
MKILTRMTGDAEAAEELCQETFIKLYQRPDGFPSREEATYWLIRVAKNLALNHGKRKWRETAAYHKALKIPPRPVDSGEAAYLKNEESRKVREALAGLPRKLREVLVLKEYGDLSYREIASVLRISEGNVKVRVYRARERLAGILRDSEEKHVP